MPSALTDYHIHIGQFGETYYDVRDVFETILESGFVKRFFYSSTTSCKGGVKYSEVAGEIENALKLVDYRVATPLFWFIPNYINQNINIERTMESLPYGGFKLHPLMDDAWNFETDTKHADTLRRIFEYAVENGVSILIHTGESGVDSPDRFERFFAEYPGVEIILAHGRPADKTIEMLRSYPNLLCDTAFMPQERFNAIAGAGLAERLLTGSDFPITHYFENIYPTETRTVDLTLKEQYRRDIAQMRTYQTIVDKEKGHALSSKI
jgi:predicted TIM-barrel fold metal-dependent hydrolase